MLLHLQFSAMLMLQDDGHDMATLWQPATNKTMASILTCC
jgi:hypothetical protein